jgi:predicted ATPase
MTNRNDMPGTVHGNVIQVGVVDTIVVSNDHFTLPPPAQLPLPPRTFANRTTELVTLSAWLDDAKDGPLVVVVSGTAGTGKSMLALRWMHMVRARFGDGQLHVDLGGFSAAGAVQPAEALEWWLLSLGVPARRIPDGVVQRAALFRSMTAGRAMALMLDDAVSVAQVRPLLPSSPSCVVVITSRHRLTGLRTIGARHVEVAPFDVTASVELLATIVGEERTGGEPADAHEVARRCGGLPLAVAVVAARLGPARTNH